MRKTTLIHLTLLTVLTACQDKEQSSVDTTSPSEETNPQEPETNVDPDPHEEPEAETEEETEEETGPQEEEESSEEEVFYLPDLLQCASQAVQGNTIRMNMQNIYGQALTDFRLSPLHTTSLIDITEVFDQTTHQSQPTLGNESIAIDLVAASRISEFGEDFFGGDALLTMSLFNGLYSGTLISDKFGELTFHCWEYKWELADDFNPDNDFMSTAKEFHYNQETGVCENQQGEQGYNHSSIIKVRETGDGECVNMSYWELEEQNYGYPNLDWNVRGSIMYGTQIHFANMIGVDFSGANMAGLEYGYTRLQGNIDDFTQLPIDCDATEDQIDCIR